MASYYFIDYCPECGGGFKVCRTNDSYEYQYDMNWHNVNPTEIWSFNNYKDAWNFAQGQPDREGIVMVSSRARKHRDRNEDYVNFPITERRKRELSQSEKQQRALAVARVTAMNDAIYFINVYGKKEQAIQAIEGHKKYWQNIVDQYDKKEDSYVA